ncbi:NAD(P)H-binding protein [Bacillus firmus]|uniref:NAD(P)H-binding protein n=1 Tax=Cytobacillus firmus TaxID=1399 RepID=UPI001580E010|nr:NAD(P)H-binding protein [Cytobacillus firmus]NUH84006.1 NAD(P)H-binding protein [Cytobacillus firmus]
MKVIVIGANGDVGELVIRKLADRKHEALAVAANENQMEDLIKMGAVQAIVYDEEKLIPYLQASDAVIYLTGVNPKKHTGKTVMVNHQSISDIIQLAQKSNGRRFVMMSAVKAEESETDPSRKIAAKDLPEDMLKAADLVYTVVRIGQLTDNPGNGTITLSEKIHDRKAEIPREDAAEVLVESLDQEAVFHSTIEAASGDTPISEALSQF